MIKVALCESSPEVLEEMEAALGEMGRLSPGAVEYECYTCGADLLAGLAGGERFHALYLNMELSDMDGIGLAKGLRAQYGDMDFLLIYLSAQPTFQRLVFDTRPFDVLPLPLDRTLYLKSLIAAVDHIGQGDPYFLCKRGRTVHQIKKREIICLESVGRDIIVTTAGQGEIRYAGAIRKALDSFGELQFLHPHQAFIVNLDYVTEYHSRHLVLTGDKTVPISELRSRQAKEHVLRFWEYNHLRHKRSSI